MDPLGFRIAKETLTIHDNISFKKKPKEEVLRDEDRCLIRIWDGGNYGNTHCPNKKLNECMCEKHIHSLERMPGGKWWLGLITEKRPENPYHPNSGNHSWKYDINGELVFIPKEEVIIIPEKEKKEDTNENENKKKRGRPRGSKNKVK